MSITETVLTFVGVPAAVVALVYGLVYGGSAARGKRYRPGRPFAPEPVWFLSSAHATGAKTAAHTAGSAHQVTGPTTVASDPADPASTGSSSPHAAHEWPEVIRTGETGGASDSW